MNQPDLFEPTTWDTPLPIGPWVKRPWKKPSYVIEERKDPRPHIGAVDPHRPLGACCIYKITNIATGKAYIGKTVDSLEKYIKGLGRRKIGIIGRALRKHGRAAFRSEIILVGSEDYCFRDVIDGKRGGMERALIAAYGTLKPGGYNLTPGGEGFTSEGMRRWHKTPEGQAVAARSGVVFGEWSGRKAGHPQRRVLAELKKGPRTRASLAASLNLTSPQVSAAIHNLCLNGHHIIWECASGLHHLTTLEEAVEAWYGGPKLRIKGRLFWTLMEGPRTTAELVALFGITDRSVEGSIGRLRENRDFTVLGRKIKRPGCVIEHRGSRGSAHHLITNTPRPTWAHCCGMSWGYGALDEDTNRVVSLEVPCQDIPPSTAPIVDLVLEALRAVGKSGASRAALAEMTGLEEEQVKGGFAYLRLTGHNIINGGSLPGRPGTYRLVTESDVATLSLQYRKE